MTDTFKTEWMQVDKAIPFVTKRQGPFYILAANCLATSLTDQTPTVSNFMVNVTRAELLNVLNFQKAIPTVADGMKLVPVTTYGRDTIVGAGLGATGGPCTTTGAVKTAAP